MSALLGVSWFAHVCGKCVFIVSLACVKLKKKGKSGLTKKKTKQPKHLPDRGVVAPSDWWLSNDNKPSVTL